MSAKWMGYFFDETELKGSELLLALAIADHADADGFCYPKMDKLAQKIRLKKRQTQVLLKKLVKAKHVEIVQGNGRGNPTHFQLKKVLHNAPFREQKRVHSHDIKGAFSQQKRVHSHSKRVHSHDIKGAFSQQERVHSGVIPIYKDEPSVEPPGEPPDTPPHAKSEKSKEKKLNTTEHEIVNITQDEMGVNLPNLSQNSLIHLIPIELKDLWRKFVKSRMVGKHDNHSNYLTQQLGYWLTDFQRNYARQIADIEKKQIQTEIPSWQVAINNCGNCDGKGRDKNKSVCRHKEVVLSA